MVCAKTCDNCVTAKVGEIQVFLKSKFPCFDEKVIADRPLKLNENEDIEDVLKALLKKLQTSLANEKTCSDTMQKILDQFFGNIESEVFSTNDVVKKEQSSRKVFSDDLVKHFKPTKISSFLDQSIYSIKKSSYFCKLPADVIDILKLIPRKAINQILESQRYLVLNLQKDYSDKYSSLFRLQKRECDSQANEGLTDSVVDDNKSVDLFYYDEDYSFQINNILSIIRNGRLGVRVDPNESIKRYPSTIIPQKYPVIVPGGRFTESYYWDTYWVIRGLLLSNDINIAQEATKNFFTMVRKYGFVPNGARTYYTDRSQPPFLTIMVNLILQKLMSDSKNVLYTKLDKAEKTNYTESAKEEYISYLKLSVPYLLDEYFSFWMNPRTMHVVNVENPNKKYDSLVDIIKEIQQNRYFLNRYYSAVEEERPESFFADSEISRQIEERFFHMNFMACGSKKKLFQSIRAACESGWDFSSRWSTLFVNKSSHDKLLEKHKKNPLEPVITPLEFFVSIDTLNIIPVDLNSILYKIEGILIDLLKQYKSYVDEEFGNNKNHNISNYFYINNIQNDSRKPIDLLLDYITIIRNQRQVAMYKYMFNNHTQMWCDYYLKTKCCSSAYSLAAFFPYWAKVTNKPVPGHLKAKALKTGFAATDVNTGQQWDFPSVWPPLVQIALEASDIAPWDFYPMYATPEKSPFVEKSISLFLNSVYLNFKNAIAANSGNLFAEKYHAVNLGQIGGGGEYENQFGFGWTSGVILDLFAQMSCSGCEFRSMKDTLNQLPEPFWISMNETQTLPWYKV